MRKPTARNFNAFIEDAKTASKKHGYKWSKTYYDALLKYFTEVCPNADIVFDSKGNPVADSDLNDTEKVPAKQDIDEYFKREVLPYASDAWMDRTKDKLGVEFPFTRLFYVYRPLRRSEEIIKELAALDAQMDKEIATLSID